MLGSAFVLLACACSIAHAQAPGAPKSYVVPSKFPSSIFASYYYGASPTQNPQPALRDPILDITYPLNLTDPTTIPQVDTDPVILPTPVGSISPAAATAFVEAELKQIEEIFSSGAFTSTCSACVAALNVFQSIAKVAPNQTAAALEGFCLSAGLASASTCAQDFGPQTEGGVWTQVLSYADVSGLDGRYICSTLGLCSAPGVYPVTIAKFPKPKPANAIAPKPSGHRVRVLHLSDFHLDPRYAVGAEAACSGGLCCRSNQHGANSSQVTLPAPLYGSFLCDTPYWLAVAALQAVKPLGTSNGTDFAWTIYTGDLVSHDPINELSQAYEEYAATSIYHMFKKFLKGPVFACLGNHDTNPTAQDAPHSLPGALGNQFSWNYNHTASLWHHDGWLTPAATRMARTHYGGYSILNQYGLRLITLNTDFWYTNNIFNLLNTSNPDQSGMFAWLIDELQSAEDSGERVWIFGHVLSGFGGGDAYPNPTDYFYQIVERYSPHVIANIFFGHSHTDLQEIFYANNGTNRNNAQGATDALVPGWVGPSVTPLTNYNSGFRVYEIDTGDFNVYEAYTFYADVQSFVTLDPAVAGPTFQFEYSTRDAYGPAAGWPADAPLNATFWHRATEAMAAQVANGSEPALAEKFNLYSTKSSIKTVPCNTTACATQLICHIRSGSTALSRECVV